LNRLLLTVLSALFLAVPAFAHDPNDLEENLPTELQDTKAQNVGQVEFQGMLRYIDEGEENRFVYRPALEVGLLPRLELCVTGTFYSGNTDREGSGNVSGELFYNFNEESGWVPATAMAVAGDFPTGEHSRGTDVTTKVILSKAPFPAFKENRLHLNLLWTYNGGKGDDERRNILKGVIGFNVGMGKDTAFVVDYVREQLEEKGEHSNVVEAGLRRVITGSTLISMGAGAGIGADSERYRVTAAIQQSF
jgi:hypothetical protein